MRKDAILQHEDRHPNTQGLIDLGMGVTGVDALLADCKAGKVQVLVLQDASLLQDAGVAEAAKAVPYVAAFSSHQGPHLVAAQALVPTAVWAETDGTFTNFDRRLQRFKRAFDPPGDARPRWEATLELLDRVGHPMNVATAADVFVEMTSETKAYADLTHRKIGALGKPLGETATQASA